MAEADSAYGSGDDEKDFITFYKQTLNINENDESKFDLEIGGPDFPRLLHNDMDEFQYYDVEKFNKLTNITADGLSTININIRGIDCNYQNLTQYINSMRHKFDVIILTECHIQLDNNYNADLHQTHPIEGYRKFYVRSLIRYGGVIIYVKEELNAEYFHGLTKTCDTHDSVFVKIGPLNARSKKPLFVGGYYRHCKEADKIVFIDRFNNDVSNKTLQKNDIIIGGDFNICLMKSTHNYDSLNFLNTIIGNTCEILIVKPTRIQYHKDSLQVKSASLIDQIITNLFEYECIAGNLWYPDSDHCATFSIFKDYKMASMCESPEILRRNLNNIDDNKLMNDFNEINWDELVYSEPDLDAATENLQKSIVKLCDKHAPLEKLSNRCKKNFNKPWIDFELANDIRLKNIAHSKKSTTPTATNRNKFNILRNQVTYKTRKKMKKYFAEYFEKFRTNSRKLWNGINSAIARTNINKSLPIAIKDTKGNKIEGDQNIANEFAKYFKNVPSQTKKKIGSIENDYLYYLHKNKKIDSYLELTNTNPEEVYDHIIKLKNNSSPGPIKVPNSFLKTISKPLSVVLAYIINRSMYSGYVPNIMKIGKQTPVHKGGDISVKNYRPITVCSNIAKILEKVVRERVMNYLRNIKILNKSQFGFRNKHSTNHAIINLLETTLEGMEQGMKVGGVFLDVAKAFDTINHRFLLRKLEYYGFRGKTLMWMESYITNRLQYVNIRNSYSELYELDWGIPQGGILAPILFILFMNDITNSSKVFDFSIYADDTCLILKIDAKNYEESMRNELKKIVDWFSSNELVLNFDKTDYLLFWPHYNKCYDKGEHDLTDMHVALPQFLFSDPFHEPGDPSHQEVNKKGEFVLSELAKVCPKLMLEEFIIMPDGSQINEPPYVKYLGVYFDNNLKFRHHINLLCSKINRIVGILWKSEHLNLETKKIIYHALVESHLNYGILAWGAPLAKNIVSNANSDHIPQNLKLLSSTQNKVLRAIFRKPKYDKITHSYTSNTLLFNKLGVLKLTDLYYFNLACLAFEFFHDKKLPEKIADNFTRSSDVSVVETRGSKIDLYCKTPRLTSTFKKPSVAASLVWNSLPAQIRQIKSKNNFKTKLKTYFLDKYNEA